MHINQVSYCQGMGDLVSPLLVVLGDEALAYVCFCAMMKRLSRNFAFDGQAMANKFHDLAQLIHYYDEKFSAYLTEVHANDLLFCYRWLLLDLKREFKFDHSLIVMEVIWASTLSPPVQEQVELFDRQLAIFCRLNTVRDKKMITGSNRSSCSHASKWKIINCRPAHLAPDSTVLRMQLNCWKNSHTSKTIQNFSPKYRYGNNMHVFFYFVVFTVATPVLLVNFLQRLFCSCRQQCSTSALTQILIPLLWQICICRFVRRQICNAIRTNLLSMMDNTGSTILSGRTLAHRLYNLPKKFGHLNPITTKSEINWMMWLKGIVVAS
ncbi:TBC1 domain family member 25 [Trichinella sp. T8]|nr:TBC1 domain family member 25 [Trichinella sp. T8]